MPVTHLNTRRRISLALVIALVAVAAVATARASSGTAWRTVARASDVSSYGTFAYLSRDVKATHALRVRLWAPRGRVKVGGSLYCWTTDYLESGTRSFGFRLTSRGRRYPLTRSVALPIDAGASGVECSVNVNADGKAGRLALYLQAVTP
jgi:hypothetical protein